MASTLPFSMIGVAGHAHSVGCWGNIGQRWLSLHLFWQTCRSVATLYPFSALVYNLRNVSVVMRCPKYWTLSVNPGRKWPNLSAWPLTSHQAHDIRCIRVLETEILEKISVVSTRTLSCGEGPLLSSGWTLVGSELSSPNLNSPG